MAGFCEEWLGVHKAGFMTRKQQWHLRKSTLNLHVYKSQLAPGRRCRLQCRSSSFLRVGVRQWTLTLLLPCLIYTAQARLWGNSSVCIVNTICHFACPDVAFLPERRMFIIIYAEHTLLKHGATKREEKPRRAKDSRDLPLGEQLVGRARSSTFLGWEVNPQLSEV